MTKTLLVTDDAMLMRVMIKDAVAEHGWEVVAEAKNGQEAIEEYRRTQPLAVTLDLVMPEFDGLHALRGIKQMAPDANIVVVSAVDQQEVLREALEAGATDFVCKPFDPDQLVQALEKIASSMAEV